jgi:large subunit ribosomal protein L9
MKVILMRKVERLGEPGQQVEVTDGYARNYLLPKRLAVLATPGRMRSLTQLTAQVKNREDRAQREAEVLAERLATVQLVFSRRAIEEAVAEFAPMPAPAPAAESAPAPAVEEGTGLMAPKLFGSVTSQDISEALAGQGVALDKRQILLEEPIKTLGVHTVPVRLHADVATTVSVTVEREA